MFTTIHNFSYLWCILECFLRGYWGTTVTNFHEIDLLATILYFFPLQNLLIVCWWLYSLVIHPYTLYGDSVHVLPMSLWVSFQFSGFLPPSKNMPVDRIKISESLILLCHITWVCCDQLFGGVGDCTLHKWGFHTSQSFTLREPHKSGRHPQIPLSQELSVTVANV